MNTSRLPVNARKDTTHPFETTSGNAASTTPPGKPRDNSSTSPVSPCYNTPSSSKSVSSKPTNKLHPPCKHLPGQSLTNPPPGKPLSAIPPGQNRSNPLPRSVSHLPSEPKPGQSDRNIPGQRANVPGKPQSSKSRTESIPGKTRRTTRRSSSKRKIYEDPNAKPWHLFKWTVSSHQLKKISILLIIGGIMLIAFAVLVTLLITLLQKPSQ